MTTTQVISTKLPSGCADSNTKATEEAQVTSDQDKQGDTGSNICNNCGAGWSDDQATPIRDYCERVEPGGIVPAGECPSCGALCYPARPDRLGLSFSQ